jgi:hypothetical protein
MTALASYSIGTVSIAAGGTTATGSGTLWSGVNARPGDILQVGNFQTVISDVTDATHLVIPPWGGGAVSGAAYTIWQTSPMRFAGAQAMADVSALITQLNNSGVLIGANNAFTGNNFFAGNVTIGSTVNQTGNKLEVDGTTAAGGSIFAARWDAGSTGSVANIQAKSRSGVIGTQTIVQNGDALALWDGQGSDGVAFKSAAQILVHVDGVPGTSDMPGRLSIWTTPDGTVTPVERLRVSNSGAVAINLVGSLNNAGGTLLNIHNTDGVSGTGWISCYQQSNDASHSYIVMRKSRGITVGSNAIVVNGDGLGELAWDGDMGSGFLNAVLLTAEVDTVPTLGQRVAGRMLFKTSVVNGSVTERMRIDSTGQIIANRIGSTAIGSGSFFTAYSVDGSNNPAFFLGVQQSNDNTGGFIQLNKSRNTTVGAHTIVQLNDVLGIVGFGGSDGANMRTPAFIQVNVDGTPTSGQKLPGRVGIFTGAVNANAIEQMRIDHTGAVFFPSVLTTGSAANAFINNGSTPANQLLRSTSSLRYKKDVAPIPQERLGALRSIRGIEFTSTSEADDPNIRMLGYAAEDVARIDPALVHWGYSDDDYIEEELDGPGVAQIIRTLKDGAVKVPDGVQYERVLLAKIEDLEQRVEELENR